MKASASRSAENGKDARQSEAKDETNSITKKSKRPKKPVDMDSTDLKSSDEMVENRVKAYYAREIKSTEMLRAMARACSQVATRQILINRDSAVLL